MAAAANTRINQAVFQGFPTLRTDRLYLRALEEEDAPALFAIRSDARVMEFLDRDTRSSAVSYAGMPKSRNGCHDVNKVVHQEQT